MECNPVDYPGRGTPLYGPLPPRREMWTYGDLAKFVLFSIAAQIPIVIFASIAAPLLLALAERLLGLSHDTATVRGIVMVAAIALSGIASLAYVYYVIAIKCRLPFREALGLTAFRRWMYWFVLLGAVVAVSQWLLEGLLGAPQDTPFTKMLRDPGVYWLMSVFGVFGAPFLEEVLFRGFLYRPLERSWGPLGAIAVTSIIFSMLHGSQYAWSWQILLILGLAGVWLGIARWKTGSLWPPILMHGGANFVSFAASGLDMWG